MVFNKHSSKNTRALINKNIVNLILQKPTAFLKKLLKQSFENKNNAPI